MLPCMFMVLTYLKRQCSSINLANDSLYWGERMMRVRHCLIIKCFWRPYLQAQGQKGSLSMRCTPGRQRSLRLSEQRGWLRGMNGMASSPMTWKNSLKKRFCYITNQRHGKRPNPKVLPFLTHNLPRLVIRISCWQNVPHAVKIYTSIDAKTLLDRCYSIIPHSPVSICRFG